MLNPPWPRASDTSSQAWVKPPSVGVHSARGPSLGSPRRASTLCTPSSANSARIDSSSSRVWPTQVRWPIGSIEVSRAIRPVTRSVVSRELPPAPYVTETNVGR